MKDSAPSLRIVTYNIHKCRGMDRRVRPERIVRVLMELRPDIVALQEVVSREGGAREEDQARFVAEELGFHFAFGENRRHKGGRYGNVVLTRFPIESHQNYDISTIWGRENRGCLRTDVRLNDATLHVFNVHFGTRFFEQRKQARKLVDDGIVVNDELRGPRIVLGDFNEWLRGSVTHTMTAHLDKANVRRHLKKSRTFPGRFPIFRLDHIYFDRTLRLKRLARHRSETALVASDHLPLVADLSLN
jgi:endonuclease/exonuclease/phosphatase family metal-dependent hydrolase